MLDIQKKLISCNYSKGVVIDVKYIVIHETGNRNKGATALMNRNYFDNPTAKASTHFIVDDKSIIQCGEYEIGKAWRMWHVGDNRGHSNIYNDNSIGIEICVNSDGDFAKARANAIELVKYLMAVLKLGANAVVTHNMASGKHCPSTMLDNPEMLKAFMAGIKGEAVVAPVAKPELKPAVSTDAVVRDIQDKLNALHIVGANGKSLVADGISGANTTYAIKEFQHIVGLSADGIVGDKTMTAMKHLCYDRPVLKVACKDVVAVRYLQFRLAIGKDGVFGNGTAKAVKAFQSRNGLLADGVVGKATWKAILGWE